MPKIAMFGSRKKAIMPRLPATRCSARSGGSSRRATHATGAVRAAPIVLPSAGMGRYCPAWATWSAMSWSMRAKASSSGSSPAITWLVRVTSAA